MPGAMPVEERKMGKKIDQSAVRGIVGASADCFCERCHARLDPAAAVWLDLSTRTGRYSDEAHPAAESQGCFAFGPDCAKAVLAAGGECVEIRERRVCGVRIRRRVREKLQGGAE